MNLNIEIEETEQDEVEQTWTCEHCGKTLHEDDVYIFDDIKMCKDCLNEGTFLCYECGNLHWNEDEYTEYRDNPLCESCYDGYYARCYECNTVIHNTDTYEGNDGYYYCYACYHDKSLNYINEYNYKPDPIFYNWFDDEDYTRDSPSSHRIYYGIELEIDKGGEESENAKELLDIANYADENLYIKHDGSLNEGMELVSHPMTIEYHTKKMTWQQLMTKALDLGYRSHDTSTCGLHIHIGRDGLSQDEDTQDEIIARILYFIEKFWDKLLVFSRRTESELSRWASRYGLKNNPKETLKNAKDTNIGRYACLNLTNDETIEFRIFKGTLKYSTFIATLQLVDEICSNAILLSDDNFHNMTWQDFVTSIDEQSNCQLIHYLKTKNLFPNVDTDSYLNETEQGEE